ncbi:c-type cytochrome [Fibrivirga algicola]|uniref:Cytochrome c n=1 Tax=Fibrivirga algicola TaxID=2950420 RepID=A0ABX0QRI2_9BACT|nr:cytochrome c [Fibrivirga algicola]NID13158.1 cytochrome c [Fibrivirga algicola]
MTKRWLLLPVLLLSWPSRPAAPIRFRSHEFAVEATKSQPDTLPTPFGPGTFGLGKTASVTQIAALDIDVRPDGTGLPAGSGTVAIGAVIFAAKCAACHGAGGTGGPNGALVVTPSVAGKRSDKVIGNYWPYATTVFDYVRRAMPFNQPGSLTNDEVYALTAFLLHTNKLINEKTTMNAKTLPAVRMPAQPNFVPDDRTGGPTIR